MKPRICVPIMGSSAWLGGVSYLENLIKAIRLLPHGEQPEVLLFLDDDKLDSISLHSHILPLFDNLIYMGDCDKQLTHALNRPFVTVNSIQELYQHIDFFFTGIDPKIAGINLGMDCSATWIPDFQHVYLPEFFHPDELNIREESFGFRAEHARMVLVSSKDAEHDFQRLYPHSKAITRVLSFATFPEDAWLDGNAEEVHKKYGLPDNFLICCNQFWIHKNHLFLFDALASLKSEGIEIPLVCTGSTSDYRYHDYFTDVRQRIVQLGIEKQVHILGTVPRADQIQLVRKSLAVVQPSLFEGWSTVVEDARAMGKTQLLSDLSVHKEQAPDYSFYFDRTNPGSLAEIIRRILPSLKPGPDLERERAAQDAAIKLVEKYARAFCRIANEACEIFGAIKTENYVLPDKQITVSAIVSTYNSEIFMRGCLEDLTGQTLFMQGGLEIVVVDSASPQNERAIVLEFIEKYGDRVRYIRTEARETIYQAWSRGIKAAHGKYITNANTDDRHRADALERMALTLDANPDVALVYADCLVTGVPNQTFGHHIRFGYHVRPEYQQEIMLSGCHMGPQPMWRRSVHDEIGYFSEQYRSAGDYEFWCRIAAKYGMMHIPKFLGLYYENPRGVANSDTGLSVQETISIQHAYADCFSPPTRDYSVNYQYYGAVAANNYVNICLVTQNSLPAFKVVIESLVKNTDYPHVVSVADLASSDGTKNFLLGLKNDGLLTNLLLLDGDTAVAEAFEQIERCEPDAGFQLAFGNSIVAGMPGWLSAFVMEAQSCPAPFVTNRIWSRDRAIKSPAGMLPAYVQDDNMETSCCMKIAACPTRV